MNPIFNVMPLRWAVCLPLALTVFFSACATVSGITEANLAQRVEQATTPADHLNLAAYFDDQAAAAERQRDKWRQLRKYYEHKPASLFYPIGTVPGMLAHYDQLIQDQQNSADECRALARVHRGLAEQVSGDKAAPEPQ